MCKNNYKSMLLDIQCINIQFLTTNVKKEEERTVQKQSFCITLKSSQYQFKLDCYKCKMLNAIPKKLFKRILKRNKNTCPHKTLYTKWRQPKCPSTDERINKIWHYP